MRKNYFLQWLLLLLWFPLISSAQKVPAKYPADEHTYYICVKAGLSRADVKLTEKNIRVHREVTDFNSVDYPVKYFLMKTNAPVEESSFREWLGNVAVIEFYGEQGPALERFPASRKSTNNQF